MDSESETFFAAYPRLRTLLALVPESVILEEIGSRAALFEAWLKEAETVIPAVNLNKVFPSELEGGSIRLENFLGHWGNVSIEELCKICLIVKWRKPKRILELGTFNGMTTLQMALNAPADCVTYTLDLAPDQAASLPLGKIDELVAKQFKDRFNTETGSYFAGRKDINIVQLWGDTATFDYSIIDGPLDVIFIDAAHDMKNKIIDTESAFRLLAPGGVILWHNYADVGNPEVTRCLADFAKTRKIYRLRNTDLTVYYQAAH
jgi:predicted O-methyltransferase YrrM